MATALRQHQPTSPSRLLLRRPLPPPARGTPGATAGVSPAGAAPTSPPPGPGPSVGPAPVNALAGGPAIGPETATAPTSGATGPTNAAPSSPPPSGPAPAAEASAPAPTAQSARKRPLLGFDIRTRRPLDLRTRGSSAIERRRRRMAACQSCGTQEQKIVYLHCRNLIP